MHLIETDAFPFEFLSQLAERESWRKEVHRPIYHVHKWWAKRLGSVFRGILLGTMLPEGDDLPAAFYKTHDFSNVDRVRPLHGLGHDDRRGPQARLSPPLARDINPVAVASVHTALGPMDRRGYPRRFDELSQGVGKEIRALYRSNDAKGRPCDVLYYFWVMQVPCPACRGAVDLFPSWVMARNAYPSRKPEVQILCPSCGDIFPGLHGQHAATCRSCKSRFDPRAVRRKGPRRPVSIAPGSFTILDAVASTGTRPAFRLYGKLVLTQGGSQGVPTRHGRGSRRLSATARPDCRRRPALGTSSAYPRAGTRLQHATSDELWLHRLARFFQR